MDYYREHSGVAVWEGWPMFFRGRHLLFHQSRHGIAMNVSLQRCINCHLVYAYHTTDLEHPTHCKALQRAGDSYVVCNGVLESVLSTGHSPSRPSE
jgi:hypothetical protein